MIEDDLGEEDRDFDFDCFCWGLRDFFSITFTLLAGNVPTWSLREPCHIRRSPWKAICVTKIISPFLKERPFLDK